MKAVSLIITVFFVAVLVSCQNSSEPIAEEKTPYMTLSIGDLRQYTLDDGTLYYQWEVIDTARRMDNQKVFKVQRTYYIGNWDFTGIQYFFIKGNYFYVTELDTFYDGQILSDNIYNEMKIAQIYPQKGDRFARNDSAVDTVEEYFNVDFQDTLVTKYGTFFNVAVFEIYDADGITKNRIYYSKKYGQLGATICNENEQVNIVANYIRVNNIVFGNYIIPPFLYGSILHKMNLFNCVGFENIKNLM